MDNSLWLIFWATLYVEGTAIKVSAVHLFPARLFAPQL